MSTLTVMRRFAGPLVIVASLALVTACGGADEAVGPATTSSDGSVSTPDPSTTTTVVPTTTSTVVATSVAVDEPTDSDMCNIGCRQTFLDLGYTESDLSMIDVLDRFNEVAVPMFIENVRGIDERVDDMGAYATLFFEDDPLSSYVYIDVFLNEGDQEDVVEFTWNRLVDIAPFWIDPDYFGDAGALLRPEIQIDVISSGGGMYLRIESADMERIARGSLAYDEWFQTYVENY